MRACIIVRQNGLSVHQPCLGQQSQAHLLLLLSMWGV